MLIDGEQIAALLQPGQAEALGIVDARVIDATGKYVLPGGVDAHTHMEVPFGPTTASDTVASGTQAAAWGGTTTKLSEEAAWPSPDEIEGDHAGTVGGERPHHGGPDARGPARHEDGSR